MKHTSYETVNVQKNFSNTLINNTHFKGLSQQLVHTPCISVHVDASNLILPCVNVISKNDTAASKEGSPHSPHLPMSKARRLARKCGCVMCVCSDSGCVSRWFLVMVHQSVLTHYYNTLNCGLVILLDVNDQVPELHTF